MRIPSKRTAYRVPLTASNARRATRYALRSCSGQFFPIAATLIFTSIILLYAVTNIYKVSRAKLEAQNLADATALAIAAMESKSINSVVDRNEWLNHLYADKDKGKSPNQFPGISKAETANFHWDDSKAQEYAKLVYTINMAQQMFSQAYNNFMGARPDGAGGVQSMNGGAGSLAEILSEIDGLNDPKVVRVIVFNSEDGAKDAEDRANKAKNDLNQGAQTDSKLQVAGQMHEVKFETEDVKVNGGQTLTSIIFKNQKPGPDQPKVGWMHPVWDDRKGGGGIEVKNSNGNSERRIGAGAIIVKAVPLFIMQGISKVVYVQAKSTAYVVKESGLSTAQGATDKPPSNFRPTYYIQLGYK